MNTNQSKMDEIDDLLAPEDWDQFPAPVLKTVQFAGHTYGVPLNVHRVNTLFYNKHVFEQVGLRPPETLDELFEVAAALKAEGFIPIALGTNDPSTLPLLLFENLLVARGGGPFYRQFFRGDVDALGPEITAVVADLGRLLSFTNANAPTLSWTSAADLVREGRAGMTIMGDWTKAYFKSKGSVPEQDFRSIPMPGTAGTFVFTTDTFGLPSGSGDNVTDKETALELLEVFGSKDGQNIFNPLKGSISPRADADISVYDDDSMAKQTIAEFRIAAMSPDTLVPATAIVAPPAYLVVITKVLAQFAIDRNASVVLHTLNNYADMLRTSPLR
jgi:glucose/mannose transport system substrate-binding protein